MSDSIDDFLASMGMPVNAANAPAQEGGPADNPPAEADLFSGSEPTGPAQAPQAAPVAEAPANTAPAIVADPANVSQDSVIVEIIRRLLAVEAALRRLGIDLS